MRVKVARDLTGVWYCRPYLGKGPDGRAIRPYKSFPAELSEEEAQKMAEEWASRLTADGSVASTRLGDVLGEYVDMLERNGASANSTRDYRSYIRAYVERFLGGELACEMTPVKFTRFEQELLDHGGRGGRPLGRSTVRQVHYFLRGAYNHFVALGICYSNPLDAVKPPRIEQKEAVAIGGGDLERLGASLAADMDPAGGADPRTFEHAFAAWLALMTGMRRGEVCAVRRRDVVRAQRCIRVSGSVVEAGGARRRGSTKSGKARNVSVTDGVLEAIDAHLAAQDARDGPHPDGCPLVTLDGGFSRPDEVSEDFSARCRALGLPDEVTFHTLRHTHATTLLMAGVDAKTVSERLGHADMVTTLRIYGHVMPGRDQEAARVFGEATGL